MHYRKEISTLGNRACADGGGLGVVTWERPDAD